MGAIVYFLVHWARRVLNVRPFHDVLANAVGGNFGEALPASESTFTLK